jgi:apolipoprotein N-acyltransferase
MAAFRAVENRVFVARTANTGITGIIDPTGRILKKGPIFAEEAMNGTIRLSSQKTFYTLYGDIFAWICSVSSILLLGWGLIQEPKKM